MLPRTTLSNEAAVLRLKADGKRCISSWHDCIGVVHARREDGAPVSGAQPPTIWKQARLRPCREKSVTAKDHLNLSSDNPTTPLAHPRTNKTSRSTAPRLACHSSHAHPPFFAFVSVPLQYSDNMADGFNNAMINRSLRAIKTVRDLQKE